MKKSKKLGDSNGVPVGGVSRITAERGGDTKRYHKYTFRQESSPDEIIFGSVYFSKGAKIPKKLIILPSLGKESEL